MGRLSRKEKRALREEGILDNVVAHPKFNVKRIVAKTANQQKTFDAFQSGKNIFLHGSAGTGKTFLSLYLTINELFNQNLTSKKKIYIVRSTVPSRDMGFLPGNQKEKMKVYEAPYEAICAELFGRGDAYSILRNKMQIEFISTSFVRGTTLEDCFVIVDECQNMSSMELHSIITRAGENCTFLFCGDVKQDDLTSERKKEYSGIIEFLSVIKMMDMFILIEFQPEDIVRSKLVKQYIIAREKLGLAS